MDALGYPHIVSLTPYQPTLQHTTLRSATSKPKTRQLELLTSTEIHDMVFLPDGHLVIFYGLHTPKDDTKAVVIGPDGRQRDDFWLWRNFKHPQKLIATASYTGRIAISYDFKDAEPQLLIYENLDALRDAQVPDAHGSKRYHRDHLVMLGGGVFFPFWHASTSAPNTEEDGVPAGNIFDANYQLTSTPLLSLRGEARYKDFNLVATYIGSVLSDEVGEAGGDISKELFQRVTALVGWNRIFFNRDVQIEFVLGRLNGLFSDKNGNAPSRAFTTDYKELTVNLLDQNRLKFGLTYRNYSFHIPLYVYVAEEGQTSFSFADSFTEDVLFHDFIFKAGFSKLDAAIHRETKYRGWYYDLDVGMGLVFAEVEGNRRVNGEKIDLAWSFVFALDGEAGYLWYHRFSPRGFGFFAKAAYKGEFDYSGGNGRPEDRNTTSDRSTRAQFNRLLLKHGPFVEAGFVF